jgi:SnoaL-like domain
MSGSNEAMVRRMVGECQSAGDLGLIDELFSPDFVNHAEVPGLPNDREGVRALFGIFHAVLEGFHVVIRDTVAAGDRVATYKTCMARTARSSRACRPPVRPSPST